MNEVSEDCNQERGCWYFPEEWENSFGRPATSLSSIQNFHAASITRKDWDVLRPARELGGDDVINCG